MPEVNYTLSKNWGDHGRTRASQLGPEIVHDIIMILPAGVRAHILQSVCWHFKGRLIPINEPRFFRFFCTCLRASFVRIVLVHALCDSYIVYAGPQGAWHQRTNGPAMSVTSRFPAMRSAWNVSSKWTLSNTFRIVAGLAHSRELSNKI